MGGEWDKAKGTAKEWQGKATDDTSTEVEGHAQQAWGEGKDAAGDAKDEASERIDRARDEESER